MLISDILLLVLFAAPPALTLRSYWDSEQRPSKSAVAGIVLCSVAMLVFMAALMLRRSFF